MYNRTSPEQYFPLFIPWLLACLLNDNPVISYLTAWSGFFFICYISLSGKIKPLPDDRNIAEQLMRPIFLVQIIFAGYMCSTSIFYFLDLMGYADFTRPDIFYLVDEKRLQLTAQCQRYYSLGHASFVAGILAFMHYPEKQKYAYNRNELLRLIFILALITVSLSYLLQFIGGLSQFSHQLNILSFIAGTLSLAFAIPQRKVLLIISSLAIYGVNFYQALTSGFKEPVILSTLLLGIFLYPSYKRVVLVTFVPLLLLLFILLPTYNRIFREQAWSAQTSANEASQLALASAFNEPDVSNWSFFAYRLSEIDMFTKYVHSSPAQVNYYGLALIAQSFKAIIPRLLWPEKPITEQLVMERVYSAGITSRKSNVSAKPAFVADAFLFAGPLGITICLFLYGAICQLISIKAEQLFGGYILGTALVFTGLFQVFWRGQSFEFLFNTVCWSYVTMYLVFYALRATNILKPS